MKFSVIIPAHNAGAYIEQAIDSVLNQRFSDYELIVVCDSCTDNTQKIVEKKGIKPIVCKAGSPGCARNRGLNKAKGDYILFLDADDYFMTPYAFQALAAYTEKDPDIIHFAFSYGGYPVKVMREGRSLWCNVWSRAWKRETIGKTRFSTKTIGEDYEFCKKIFEQTTNQIIFDVPLVFYRRHDEQITARNDYVKNNNK